MSQVFKIWKRELKIIFRAEISQFCCLVVREGEKKNPNFSLRSMEYCQSKFIERRTKVHLLDEGYPWVPKTWDFAKDLRLELGKSKVSGLRSVHGTF